MNEVLTILGLILSTILITKIYYDTKIKIYYESELKDLKASIDFIYTLAKKVESSLSTECEYKRLITFIEEVRKDE